MKNAYRCCTAVLAALLLTMCAAPPADIGTTVDPQVNFSGYRTFAFLDSTPTTPGAITDQAAQSRLRRMISSRLEKRGYVPAASAQAADLGVHFSAQVVPKQSVLMVGRPGPYDYSWGRTELGGYDTMDYRQGTLFIDVVELAANKLVWRARVSEALSASYSDDNWKKVDVALDQAFQSLPPRR